jgi:SAM-dependent methyltransferase
LKLLKKLKTVYEKEQFHPGWLGLFINPFYFARKELAQNIASMARHMGHKILDVGCGQKPYASLFDSSAYVGLEFDTPANRAKGVADVYYDGGGFPFPAQEFDAVICSQVLEHVFNPGEFLTEVHRVLRDGGKLLLTVPFVWDEHEQPYDFARYSSFGIKYLLEQHGLDIIEHKKTLADVRVLFQLANAYFYKWLVGGNAYWNLLATLVFMSPLNLLGALVYKVLPRNDDLYLDNVVLARKRKPK